MLGHSDSRAAAEDLPFTLLFFFCFVVTRRFLRQTFRAENPEAHTKAPHKPLVVGFLKLFANLIGARLNQPVYGSPAATVII